MVNDRPLAHWLKSWIVGWHRSSAISVILYVILFIAWRLTSDLPVEDVSCEDDIEAGYKLLQTLRWPCNRKLPHFREIRSTDLAEGEYQFVATLPHVTCAHVARLCPGTHSSAYF